MDVFSNSSIPAGYTTPPHVPAQPASGLLGSKSSTKPPDELRKAFHDFVGQTFFAEMIKACRSSQQPSEYFHGGRAEEIFQGQLDQVLSEELSNSSADKIADPMYELFMLNRRS
jgi:peptidoglycan hydrolase FlgJ